MNLNKYTMCKFTKSYDERYDRIMNEPIWPSRLMFNASMMYRKSVEDLTDVELFEVRRHSLGLKKFLQN